MRWCPSPSCCPSPNADSILRATQDVQRELNSDCNLCDLNIIYNLMTTDSKSNGEDKVDLPGWVPEDWVKPGSCPGSWEQKHIGMWREAIEPEMNIRQSETYRRPTGARYLVGPSLAPMCESRYPVQFVAVDVKRTRTIVGHAFSVPKRVRLARMSE